MPPFSRRALLRATAIGAAGLPLAAAGCGSPTLVRADRPVLTHGVQSGDVQPGSGLVWTRADRPSRMVVEVADNPEFLRPQRLPGPALTPDTDHTGKLRIPGSGTVHYRVTAEDLDGRTSSEPLTGSFRTPPGSDGGARFVWSGDIVGQGWASTPTKAG